MLQRRQTVRWFISNGTRARTRAPAAAARPDLVEREQPEGDGAQHGVVHAHIRAARRRVDASASARAVRGDFCATREKTILKVGQSKVGQSTCTCHTPTV